jgi:hypothetical protein
VDIRLKEQEHDRSIVELKVSCTKILPSDLLHQSVSINIIVICFAKSIIKFLLSLFQEQHILLHVFFPDYHTLNLPLQFFFPVTMLREELQLLQQPASYVVEVVKVMEKSKVLMKGFFKILLYSQSFV